MEKPQLNKTIQKGTDKPNSIKCLVFGIISIVLSSLALEFISFFKIEAFFILRVIIFNFMNIIGILCGILAVIFNRKAQERELDNNIEKAGSVVGKLGLAFNILIFLSISIFLIRLGVDFLFE
ncbi:MAG: hypothetical protein R6W84_17905 [Promethearchaeia archaeon]